MADPIGDGRCRADRLKRSGQVGPGRSCISIVLLAWSMCLACNGAPDVGPLNPPPSEAPAENYSGFEAQLNHPFTFGLIFIRNYGGDAVVLDGVELIDKTPGIELVGLLAADITGDRQTWSSDDNYPPLHPADLEELQGFHVRPQAAQAVQILLGIELTRAGKHGFRAVAILYHRGEEHFRYTYPSGVAACSESFYASHPNETCNARLLFAS